MKNVLFLCICAFLLFSCKEKSKYQAFGKAITTANVKDILFISEQYNNMEVGDSIGYKIKAQVNDVCKAKGCWMTLNLKENKEVMVKFKDYGFFVPKDITGKTVIVEGSAFVSEVPVEVLRHYAKDAGKSDEDIAAILKPERMLLFEAEGVLIEQ